MAQRRSFQNMYDGYEGDPFEDDGGGMIGGDFAPGGAPFEAPSAPPPNPQDPFGNGRDRPDAFYNLSPEEQQAIIDLQNGAIGGNQETAREIGGWSRPNTPVTQQPNLPQAVSVEERGGPEQSFAQDTPQMSMAPDPVAASTPQPMQTSAPPPMGAPTGPQRPSIVSNAAPALFAESGGGGRMFGSAGGLMGGGRGVMGSNPGGPTPTEMMLSIMRQLRNGG